MGGKDALSTIKARGNPQVALVVNDCGQLVPRRGALKKEDAKMKNDLRWEEEESPKIRD